MTDMPETPIDAQADDADFSDAVSTGGGRRWLMPAAVVLIIVILIVGAVAGGVGPFAKTPTAWSGVFLTDNEVFFGHVKGITADDIDLVNVYYVQSSQGTATGTTPQSAQLAVLGLVGTQIQCPTDELIINRHAVLDVQELQSSSFVVSRLETLAKTNQACFQPAAAAATPSAAASPGASPAASAAATSTATPPRSATP